VRIPIHDLCGSSFLESLFDADALIDAATRFGDISEEVAALTVNHANQVAEEVVELQLARQTVQAQPMVKPKRQGLFSFPFLRQRISEPQKEVLLSFRRVDLSSVRVGSLCLIPSVRVGSLCLIPSVRVGSLCLIPSVRVHQFQCFQLSTCHLS
jgi:hypothetical protein